MFRTILTRTNLFNASNIPRRSVTLKPIDNKYFEWDGYVHRNIMTLCTCLGTGVGALIAYKSYKENNPPGPFGIAKPRNRRTLTEQVSNASIIISSGSLVGCTAGFMVGATFPIWVFTVPAVLFGAGVGTCVGSYEYYSAYINRANK
jgi:hypothetical protein